MDNRPIGVFDSGVGGLTVVKEIMRALPDESICYFGDTMRAPYGELPNETIIAYARQIVTFLLGQNVKAMVAACNTMSATCLDLLSAALPVPIIGMVEPGVEAAAETASASVCLLATAATVASGLHERLLRDRDSRLIFHARACPGFVALVEAGQGDSAAAVDAAHRVMADLDMSRIDTVILGCTHYPLMGKAIQQAAGQHVALVNPARKTAEMLENLLAKHRLLCMPRQVPQYRIYVSGDTDKCDFILKQLFGDVLCAETTVL